ncbi:conserved hypothetical protein [Pseudomonas veronii]|uniref:type IV pilus biogenesis protein PilI n=1 Tax=Pseudomonas veronii TaxID=76761 RepID=UPI0017772241|nr:hypothetical protein [Pseudomonas veronii]CAD0264241.1 conserved hypothetical protein [Pseudomonas veronii]
MTPGVQKIEVTIRTNEGEDKTVPAPDIADALKSAKRLRTPDSHMVCIVQDGVRKTRWDRPTVVGENRWRKVDPCAFERLGPVRESIRTYIYTTVEQEQAKREAWLSACPDDNEDFAIEINQQIATATMELAPQVREAIISVYERLGISAMLDLIRKSPISVDTHLAYQAFNEQLRPLDPLYTPFSFCSECCGIKHPSIDLPNTVLAQLKDRGFQRSFVGWCDARGVQIDEWNWLELNRVRRDPTSAYGWYDPAGIRKIYETYTDAIRKLQTEAGPTVRTFEQRKSAGWDAYRDGQLVSACTSAPDSLEGYAWTLGWQNAFKWRADLPHEQVQRLRESGLVSIGL